ncbi:MAG: hypothetical protein J2P37_07905 [Ktedonobacteraceae bacterium]|nr:hypothetical protein [Ktedonobacteraceae bacterium]MBO0795003.1 hypothetical protein [Ktedonobacteraceae bacterium]
MFLKKLSTSKKISISLAGLAVLTLAVALLIGSSAMQTDAASRYVRGDACGTGVCGSATFQFRNSAQLMNITYSVKDTKCDSHDVYIQLRVFDQRGGHHDLTRHYNSSGCGANATRYVSGYSNPSSDIKGIQVITCVDDFGSNTCYYSRYIDDPYIS